MVCARDAWPPADLPMWVKCNFFWLKICEYQIIVLNLPLLDDFTLIYLKSPPEVGSVLHQPLLVFTKSHIRSPSLAQPSKPTNQGHENNLCGERRGAGSGIFC